MRCKTVFSHRQFAPAKINLALHVTGKRVDGLHLLDSLVVFADFGDRLSFARGDKTQLDLCGKFAAKLDADPDNLVFKAHELLKRHCGADCQEARIELQKNLPVASGIGGGSADAAAALRGLIELFELTLPAADLQLIAVGLGADVPVCLASQSCRMRGIGEELQPLDDFPAIPALLVNPGIAVSTAAVFKSLGLGGNGETAGGLPPGVDDIGDITAAIGWLNTCRNDLQLPAVELVPEIGHCLEVLSGLDKVRLVRMSGSGGTCFALFETLADRDGAAAQFHRVKPHWWSQAVILGNGAEFEIKPG